MPREELGWTAFLEALNSSPLVVEMQPVLYAFLPSDIKVVDTSAEASWLFDDPEPTLPTKMIIRKEDPCYQGRFPHVQCYHDPFSKDLNNVLLKRFELISDNMLCQSRISSRMISNTNRETKVVVLFLVDGLSYEQVRQVVAEDQLCSAFQLHPCLVDVPTITRIAFPNIVGNPAVSMRLFDQGFYYRTGFSYWTREDNELSNQIFQGISQVEKVGQFGFIMASLRQILGKLGDERAFIQILRTGLDGYVHAQKRRPPIEAIVDEVLSEFDQIVDLCRTMNLRAQLYLTADHGILWRDDFEPRILGTTSAQTSPRYFGWRELYEYETVPYRQFTWQNEEFYCLDVPYLRRPLRIDEQGVHGGVSYEESIVPFISAFV